MSMKDIWNYQALAPSAPETIPAEKPSWWIRMRVLVQRSWRTALTLVVMFSVLGVAAAYTGFNLFHYPQYELDEGTYVSSAWTMVTRYKLFYYTYAYAHPPLGWFQLGVWSELTGGFDQFGMSINSGRVFMLVIAVLSTLMIFWIVMAQTGRSSAAALAGLFYSASPLAISLHRQVYLDNIGTLWLLASILLVQTAKNRLSRIILSAVTFGIAFLTKEVFLAFLPGMVVLVFFAAHPLQRRFSVPLWLMTSLSFISTFTLLAFLKDELLPPGMLWSSTKPHVSLLETYTHQASRGGGGLLDPHGSFWHNADLWWVNAPVFMTVGTAATFLCLLFWRKDRATFSLAILAVSFVLFLGRGGIVIYYYVIPLLAIMALAVGFISGHLVNWMSRWGGVRYVMSPLLLVGCILYAGYTGARNDLNFSVDATTSQTQAATWVARNLSPGSMIIMDAYAWQDLRGTSLTRGQPFLHAHYYWPLLSDPGLTTSELNNNWQTIDYLMVSPNTLQDARSNALPLLPEALERSDPIRTFSSGNWSETILRVRKLHQMLVSEDPILSRTWSGDKIRFIQQNGRVVVNPDTQESTSQGQASALLRAVYANDRATFNKVMNWTQGNLAIRGDGLLASSWVPGANGGPGQLRSITMTEGDEDAALALLFAYQQWGDPAYKVAALSLINGIWENETVQIAGGDRVVVAGSWAKGGSGGEGPIVSLGALAPYAYRIFADADPSHDWLSVVDSTYSLLGQIREAPDLGGDVGLVPDVVQLDPKTGKPHLAGDTRAGGDTFTENGSRLLWRLTIDYLWFQDSQARNAISGLHFFRDQLKKPNAQFFGEYAMDGSAVNGDSNLALTAGVIPSLMITGDANLDVVNSAFATKLLKNYTDLGNPPYWGKDKNDYTVQTWAWMTTAVMDGAISNLSNGDRLLDWNAILDQR